MISSADSISTEHLALVLHFVLLLSSSQSIKVFILEIREFILPLVKQVLAVQFFLCNLFMFIRKWGGQEIHLSFLPNYLPHLELSGSQGFRAY